MSEYILWSGLPLECNVSDSILIDDSLFVIVNKQVLISCNITNKKIKVIIGSMKIGSLMIDGHYSEYSDSMGMIFMGIYIFIRLNQLDWVLIDVKTMQLQLNGQTQNGYQIRPIFDQIDNIKQLQGIIAYSPIEFTSPSNLTTNPAAFDGVGDINRTKNIQCYYDINTKMRYVLKDEFDMVYWNTKNTYSIMHNIQDDLSPDIYTINNENKSYQYSTEMTYITTYGGYSWFYKATNLLLGDKEEGNQFMIIIDNIINTPLSWTIDGNYVKSTVTNTKIIVESTKLIAIFDVNSLSIITINKKPKEATYIRQSYICFVNLMLRSINIFDDNAIHCGQYILDDIQYMSSFVYIPKHLVVTYTNHTHIDVVVY